MIHTKTSSPGKLMLLNLTSAAGSRGCVLLKLYLLHAGLDRHVADSACTLRAGQVR